MSFSQLSGFIRFFKAELRPFPVSLKSKGFWLSLVITAVFLLAAYQLPYIKNLDLDSTADKPFLQGFFGTEHFDNKAFNWTKPNAGVSLPRTGSYPSGKITLQLATRPDGTAPAHINLSINSNTLANLTSPNVQEFYKTYEINFREENRELISPGGNGFFMNMAMEPLKMPGDPRSLGIAVTGLKIEENGLFQAGRPVIPDWGLVVFVLTSLAIMFFLGVRAGWNPRTTAWSILALGTGMAVWLALDRATLGQVVPVLFTSVLLVYPLTVFGMHFTGWWLKRKKLSFATRSQQWLALIFALAFVIRLTGLNQPAFQTIDHTFRIHEVAAIESNPSLIFTRYYSITSGQALGGSSRGAIAGQWDVKMSIPYTPLFYLLDLPIAFLAVPSDPTLLFWTNVLGVWLDVSALFFLYLIARMLLGRYGEIAGLVGAMLQCFFPLAFLMVSDGGYNTMLATWFTLAWLAAMSSWLVPEEQEVTGKGSAPDYADFRKLSLKLPGWKRVTGTGVLLALAFLAHTATLLIVATFCIIFSTILFVTGGGRYRYLFRRIAAMLGTGLLLSFVLYYGFYLISFFSQSLPQISNKLGSGQSIGADSFRSSGSWIWQPLISHFHLVPFLATLALLVWLPVLKLKKARGQGPLKGFNARLDYEISSPVVSLLVSWLVTFLLFAVINERVDLLQKHMLFVMPLLALGTGLALTVLFDYFATLPRTGFIANSRWVKLFGYFALGAVPVWFLVAGTYTWYIRAIYYVLPAGSG